MTYIAFHLHKCVMLDRPDPPFLIEGAAAPDYTVLWYKMMLIIYDDGLITDNQ